MSVEPHKHCPVCSKPIPLTEKVCSPDCEKILAQKQTQMKKSRRNLYIVMAIFIIVLIWFVFTKLHF